MLFVPHICTTIKAQAGLIQMILATQPTNPTRQILSEFDGADNIQLRANYEETEKMKPMVPHDMIP
jgi:hypothetical protein